MSEIDNELQLPDYMEMPPLPATASPKKKTKLKATDLKKLQNLNEPTYQPLDKLSPDDLIDTVVSTYYNPKFMQPKIDTIILHHWEDIFSKSLFNWQIVLNEPNCIIAPRYHSSKGLPIYMCRPFPKCKGMYEVVQMNDRGRIIRHLSNENVPLTLKEAVNLCDKKLYNNGCSPNGMMWHLSNQNIIDEPFAFINNILCGFYDSLEDYTLNIYGIGDIEAVLTKLQDKGVSPANIARLRATSFQHVFYVFNKLKNDVSITRDELVKASQLYYNPAILSKRHLYWVYKNTPEVLFTVQNNDSDDNLTFVKLGITNLNKLTPNNKKAIKKEIDDIIKEAEEKINKLIQ